MTGTTTMIDDRLRAAVAADLVPVRPLGSPWRRAIVLMPFALLLLLAAPVAFEFRDLSSLGWLWSWGASIAQMAAGLSIAALALREAVPGRELRTGPLVAIVSAAVALFAVVTFGSWSASPVTLARAWLQIGLMCAIGSAASALPVVVLGSVLIVRAFPLHPARTGALAGLGAGLLADAGWRLFCHFSEPAHVIVAHLGGVGVATMAAAWLTSWMVRRDVSRRTPGAAPVVRGARSALQ